jgi:hypothetical protein
MKADRSGLYLAFATCERWGILPSAFAKLEAQEQRYLLAYHMLRQEEDCQKNLPQQ